MKKYNVYVKGANKTIKVILFAENIGNFNPIFCKYHGKKYLVSSELGDLSDPFRREESYLEKLYIEVEGK